MPNKEIASKFVRQFVGVPHLNTAYFVVDYNEELDAFGVVDINSMGVYDVIQGASEEINSWQIMGDTSNVRQFIQHVYDQNIQVIERMEKHLTELKATSSVLLQFLTEKVELN